MNTFIDNPLGSNHSSRESEDHEHTCNNSSLSIRYQIDQDNASNLVSNGCAVENQPSAKSVYNSIYDEPDDPSSRYSKNSRSSVWETVYGKLTERNKSFLRESYREEEESRRYDSELVERDTSSDDSSYCSSTSYAKDNYDDDMYYQSKSGGHKCCCGQTSWSIVAFAAAFLIMIMAGAVVLLCGAFGSDLVPSSGVGTNGTYVTNMPSIAPTGIHSGQPSHAPSKLTTKTPSIAPSRRPIYWPTGGPSKVPSNYPSSIPTLSQKTGRA